MRGALKYDTPKHRDSYSCMLAISLNRDRGRYNRQYVSVEKLQQNHFGLV